MLSIEEIRERLKDRRLSVVSEKTGLHYNTIKNLRDGGDENPKYQTVKTLSEYLSVENG